MLTILNLSTMAQAKTMPVIASFWKAFLSLAVIFPHGIKQLLRAVTDEHTLATLQSKSKMEL
jgi:hypothetical protein